LPIGDCRLQIHGVPIEDRRFGVGIVDWIGDCRLATPDSAGTSANRQVNRQSAIDRQSAISIGNRQSAIESPIVNVNRQSPIGNP
jgi:hypothetical protein